MFLPASAAGAGERIAILVANQAYQNVEALRNPRADVDLIDANLKELKFKTYKFKDLSARDFGASLDHLIAEVNKLGDRRIEAILFYYAGHGVQFDGANYLLPIDVRPSVDGIKETGVELNRLIARFNSLKAVNFIFVVDACRNNPFGTDDVGNGLAEVDAGPNNYILFSAKPGQPALDGEGNNSPFASALSYAMMKQGITIESTVREARKSLYQSTGQRQIVWDASSLFEPFYFAPTSNYGETEILQPRAEQAKELWSTAESRGFPEYMLRKYLLLYPDGEKVEDAKEMLTNIEATKQIE